MLTLLPLVFIIICCPFLKSFVSGQWQVVTGLQMMVSCMLRRDDREISIITEHATYHVYIYRLFSLFITGGFMKICVDSVVTVIICKYFSKHQNPSRTEQSDPSGVITCLIQRRPTVGTTNDRTLSDFNITCSIFLKAKAN